MRRAATEAKHVVRGQKATHRHLRFRLVLLLVATIAVDAVATVAIFLFERHATGSDIQTIGSAAFWTSAQLLTVSSNLSNPISAGARAIDIALEFYAVLFVAWLAGAFGAYFHRRGLELDGLEPDTD